MKKIVYHTSAGGFILHKGKILLVKNFYHGGIIPPHGHKEKGESLLETAKREICEETGYCHLRPLKRLGFVTYTYKAGSTTHRKKEYRWLFELTKDEKQKKQTEESELLQNRWYTIEGALKAATFENTRKDLRIIQRYLAQREKVRHRKK